MQRALHVEWHCRAQVKRGQLALLEFVLKACAREDTAIMARRSALTPRHLFLNRLDCRHCLLLCTCRTVPLQVQHASWDSSHLKSACVLSGPS